MLWKEMTIKDGGKCKEIEKKEFMKIQVSLSK